MSEITFKITCDHCSRSNVMSDGVRAYIEYDEQFGEVLVFQCLCGNKWVNHYPLEQD
jgi:hypothetical protein